MQVKFYPYEKGEGGKSFSHAEGWGGGGHSKFWGSFDVLAILMGRGVAKSLHPLNWGGGWRAKPFTLS